MKERLLHAAEKGFRVAAILLGGGILGFFFLLFVRLLIAWLTGAD